MSRGCGTSPGTELHQLPGQPVPLLVTGTAPFALLLAELHEVPASPSLQPAQVPRDGSTTPWPAPLLPVQCHLPPCCGYAQPHHPDPQCREVLNRIGPGPGPWVTPPSTGLALHLVPWSSTLGTGRPAWAQCPLLPTRPTRVRSGDLKSVLKRRQCVMGTRKHTAFNIPGHKPPTPGISTNYPKAYREENTPQTSQTRPARAFNSSFSFPSCCFQRSAVFARRSQRLNTD